MKDAPESLKNKLKETFDNVRWQEYVSGRVEGALDILYALDMDKERRIELLSETLGRCNATATNFIEPREIIYRIKKSNNLSADKKHALLRLMSNETMDDKTALSSPEQTMKLISSFCDKDIIEECLPKVKEWIEGGEDVSMHRIKEFFVEKYELL